MKIAGIGDLHVERMPTEKSYVEIFERISKEADVLALCGDLTTEGRIEQAKYLVEQLKSINIPIVAVLGNHDFESGQEEEIIDLLREQNIRLLDGESHVIGNVGFAGVKGFGGGFRGRMLAGFGEMAIKRFSNEAVRESLRLEKALQSLDTEKKVVLLHYAPIRETVEGENLEIYPFLGSGRLEESIDNAEVTAVFHGHAHHGTLEGKTSGGVNVYNVAIPLLIKHFPESPYKIIEV